MATKSSMQGTDMGDLLMGLCSREDGTRKMAAFKLQTLCNDPAFAEHFVARGGLSKLHDLVLETSGNTQAYALASFARLLEVDQGWEAVDAKIVEKAVAVVVSQPLVNILRGAMAVLASIVSRPHPDEKESGPFVGGFKALKPAINSHPQFLDMLVSRLSSADHALCANALQLINALMRDAIAGSDEAEWPKFIKRLQDLGVIKAVYVLMQSSALQDLAHPLLEFQQLTKVLLARWRDVAVDIMKPEHRRTIKAIHLASNPPDKHQLQEATENGNKPRHDPYKWRRLGFTTENPEPDFEDLGFLGMMDLSDYVRKNQDEFQNILAQQSSQPQPNRCPLARASLTITAILFEHFEVDKMDDDDDQKAYAVLESRANYEKVFRPVLLHWNRLHIAGLHAFLRLWRETDAEMADFFKIMDLVRILIESVVGGAERTKGIEAIEQELAVFECTRLRALQMELLDLTYEDIWGPHLRGAKEELHSEALQFLKEQRIRCLLEGAWFPNNVAYRDHELGGPVQANNIDQDYVQDYRFIRLSPDRRYLHWGNFEDTDGQPLVSDLPNRIDLAIISSVVSNISANEQGKLGVPKVDGTENQQFNSTKITIHGYEPGTRGKGHTRSHSRTSSRTGAKEVVLLMFHPQSHTVASEWLDGLLMLLDQQPITAETNKIVKMIAEMGLKVRLLNVRGNEEGGIVGGVDGIEPPPIPSREDLDEDYYYEI